MSVLEQNVICRMISTSFYFWYHQIMKFNSLLFSSFSQSNVEDRLPAVLKLEEESRSLREFHVLDIEVPGQYFNDQVNLSLCF